MQNILKFSKATYIATHGLVLLARSYPKSKSALVLAKELDSSVNHLAKIFQKLVKAKIVLSKTGPTGGFTLKNFDINFLEIFTIVEQDISIYGCPFQNEKCVFKECIFEDKFKKISYDMLKQLENMNIKNYLKKG